MLSEVDFSFLKAQMRERTGIVFDEERRHLITSRLEQLARREGATSVAAMMREARQEEGPLLARIIAFLINHETYFFRDWHPFETLRTVLLPELIERRRDARRLRIWSAACSTGQEPYSVAMMLDAHFPELASWDLELLATDIDAAVLERARLGVYSQLEISRGLPTPMLLRYFTQETPNSWRIAEALRSRVRFASHNLLDTPWSHAERWDLIMMRNICIYFDRETRTRLLAEVASNLRSEGVLLLGASESTLGIDAPLRARFCQKSIAYIPTGGCGPFTA